MPVTNRTWCIRIISIDPNGIQGRSRELSRFPGTQIRRWLPPTGCAWTQLETRPRICHSNATQNNNILKTSGNERIAWRIATTYARTRDLWNYPNEMCTAYRVQCVFTRLRWYPIARVAPCILCHVQYTRIGLFGKRITKTKRPSVFGSVVDISATVFSDEIVTTGLVFPLHGDSGNNLSFYLNRIMWNGSYNRASRREMRSVLGPKSSDPPNWNQIRTISFIPTETQTSINLGRSRIYNK